jgi:hypothetical protein
MVFKSSAQIIQHDYFMAHVHAVAHYVRTNKSGAAGDQYSRFHIYYFKVVIRL